jgi:hypothetical protein
MGQPNITAITYSMKEYPLLQEAVIPLGGGDLFPNIFGKYSGSVLKGYKNSLI